MPKYKIPCWIPTTHEFEVVVEAKDADAAFNKLIDMLHSTDNDTIDYIENCVNIGRSSGMENSVDFYRDVLTLEEITDEEAHRFNLSVRPTRFEEPSDGC